MIHINLHIPLAMLSFYPVPWCYSALPFTLSSNTFPGLFCNVDMIEMNYLHFYLCMAVFVSPSCLKDSFNLLTDFFSLPQFEFATPPPSNFQFANEESISIRPLFRTMLLLWRPLQFSLQLDCSVVYKCILCFLTESPWNFCMFNFFINANNCNNQIIIKANNKANNLVTSTFFFF